MGSGLTRGERKSVSLGADASVYGSCYWPAYESTHGMRIRDHIDWPVWSIGMMHGAQKNRTIKCNNNISTRGAGYECS